MAAPTVRGAATSNTGTASVVGGTTSGDLVIAVVCSKPSGNAVSPSSGWTELSGSPLVHTTDIKPQRASCFYRVLDGSSADTLTMSAGQEYEISTITITGNTFSLPLTAATNFDATFDMSETLAGLTTPVANCLIVYLATNQRDEVSTDAWTSWTAPGAETVTERADNTHSNGNGGGSAIATFVRVSSGAMGTGSATRGGNSLDASFTVAIRGAEADRITQLPVEVAVKPDDAKARTGQEPVEVAVKPDDAKARTGQVVVEVAAQTNPPLRLTQEPVEALVRPDNAQVRLTQEPVEVLAQPDTAQVRMTQIPVEVLMQVIPPAGNRFRAYVID